jgi:hypothetical protein
MSAAVKKKVLKPKVPTRPAVTHGGKRIEIPALTGPVGASHPDLLSKHKVFNATKDIEVIEYYLSQLADIKFLASTCSPLQKPGDKVVQAADAVACWDSSMNEAIAAFQRQAAVTDAEELRYGIIKPDGATLKALVDFGDIAEKLREQRDAPKLAKDYTHTGGFDQQKFRDAFTARRTEHQYFRVRFTPSAVDNAWTLVQMMQADPLIMDIRWMAYMLATAFWEAAHTVPITIQVPKLDKHKQPVLDEKKQPVLVDKTIKVWDVMVPIDEISPSDTRRYKAALKIRKITEADHELLKKQSKIFESESAVDGAWIVEKDGDQFVIDSSGKKKWHSKNAVRGAAFKVDAAKSYTAFSGAEFAYYGRGYVQLTWWDNYLSSGIALGKGLELLFDPEMVKQPQIAYQLMSHGMRTGKGFANGRKFSDYFYGATSNYNKARRMVNARDTSSYEPIAEIAVLFEQMLFESKL